MLAYGGIKALVALLPDGAIPSESVIELNLPVLLGSAGIAVLTVIIFGLAPALNTAKADIVEPLKSSGKGASGGFRQGKLRSTLVVVEVALSLVLLTGAGLLMRSFIALVKVDLGLNPATTGDVIRVPMPALNEERRKELIKVLRTEAEGARVSIRNVRRDANTAFKEMLKNKALTEDEERRLNDDVQKLTDKFVAEVDQLLSTKETDLMAI